MRLLDKPQASAMDVFELCAGATTDTGLRARLEAILPDIRDASAAYDAAAPLARLHHLPKSRYPDLSVSPINLVPCCMDCNTNKRAIFPTSGQEETLHPYYDNFEGEKWLQAT